MLVQAPVSAQESTYQSSPERRTIADAKDWGPWLGPFREKLVPSLMRDFGERYIYADRNAALPPPAEGGQRVVFLGDSITDRWDLARYFPGKSYVNRGIGSQVTAQMMLRFHPDVIDLHPDAVVIMGGINDLQGFLQRESVAQIEAHYEAMAEMARAHGIAVVFASVTPVSADTPESANVLKERSPAKIDELNAWLRAYCAAHGYVFADYWTALADDRGLMARGLTRDGIHPLAAGYSKMAQIASNAIARALRTAPAI
ncbi:GDSL family lipase [Sphingomonadaceae bacterium LXI357]|uniref:GDSL family lipase n=2 Tax=Stakelama marina TaxID=2826939 RepID=A0A8T4IDZ9_9SPHN|nr:GDSL family lipase [Stakelama marina]